MNMNDNLVEIIVRLNEASLMQKESLATEALQEISTIVAIIDHRLSALEAK
ncbi:MAG: hypothetical protein OXR68_00205 [Alphaproteobacteria bacterium]|nr:hypothetical protein [Alphaproteobacteria bacterium]MDD9919033.1 hypothetical protein [Alphaproteobacteria bacterium]